MAPLEAVTELIRSAASALAEECLVDAELFVERVDTYLQKLESWQAEIREVNPFAGNSLLSEREKEELRLRIEELNEKHQLLMTRASSVKDDVGEKMGDLHRRSSGLKKYVDTFPPRITIAGKREG